MFSVHTTENVVLVRRIDAIVLTAAVCVVYCEQFACGAVNRVFVFVCALKRLA